MKKSEIQNWLGLYFLLITGILGGYLLLLKETPFLPIRKAEAITSFEILIPVLIGQLTIIFKWYGKDRNQKDIFVKIPKWVVKAPPILVVCLLVITIIMLIITNLGKGKMWALSADTFQAIITFCATILNATTIFIITRFFNLEE